MQKLIKILSEPGNLKLNFSENDEPWSNGFSVSLDVNNDLGFDRSKLNEGLLYAAPHDLAAAWQDICKLPLSEWLFVPKAPAEAAELTIEDAMTAECASVELYDLIRSRSKYWGRQQSPGILPEFFAAVYLLAIVASEIYLQIGISSQSLAALQKKAAELSACDWLTGPARTLLANYCRK